MALALAAIVAAWAVVRLIASTNVRGAKATHICTVFAAKIQSSTALILTKKKTSPASNGDGLASIAPPIDKRS